jgi:hypothetical protein
MKLKGFGFLLTVWVLLFSSATYAFADPSPTPSTTPDFQTMMNQYKVDLDQYRFLLKNRDQHRIQINRIFMIAVDSANREARMSMRLAKTASEKTDVIAKQKSAVTAASDARDIAIAALGALPTPPMKPFIQAEMAPTNKMKPQKPSPISTRKSRN